MDRIERRGVRARLESGEVRSLATVRALQKGFDAPMLDCAILTTLGSEVSTIQSEGRVMRPYAGKPDPIVDDLKGATWLWGLPDDDRVWSLEGAQGRPVREPTAGLRRCASCHAVYPPATRCPRCGSIHVTDARPLRVQRAEMFEASGLSIESRSKLYREGIERKLLRAGKSAFVAAKIAAKAVPPWERKSADGGGHAA